MRCGCAGACNCIIEAGQGVTVTGNGGVQAPYRVGTYASRDAGNCLRYGSDAGIYVACEGEAGQDICGISVANLPEERVVFGRGGAGRLLAPDHMLTSYTRAVDLGLDGSHAQVRELGDGTPVCFPTTDMDNRSGLSGLNLRELGVGRYKTVPLRVGWQPETAAQNPGPFDNLGRRHGTFGYDEPDVVGGATLAEVLAAVGRRAVLLLEMVGPYSESFPDKVLSLIYRYCSHESVIVGARDLDALEPFVESGIPTCLWVPDEDAAAENPPQTLVERGVEWVCARMRLLDDATLVGYSTTGLNVIGYMCQRHHDWQRLDAVGARATVSDDGLYMTMDPARYRSPTMAETLTHAQVQPGMLGYWCDERPEATGGPGQPGEAHWPHQARGFYYPDGWLDSVSALYLPFRAPAASGVDEYSGVPYRTPSGVFDVLMGWMAPLPWPDDYTLDIEVSYRDTPNTNRPVGLLLGLDDDRAFDDPEFPANYWACGIRWNGSIYAQRFEGGQMVTNESVSGNQLSEDSFYRLRFIVTPSAVTVQRLTGSGEVEAETTAQDSAQRGPYLSMFKNELSGSTWDPYAVAWRNLSARANAETASARLALAGPVADEGPNTDDGAPGQPVRVGGSRPGD